MKCQSCEANWRQMIAGYNHSGSQCHKCGEYKRAYYLVNGAEDSVFTDTIVLCNAKFYSIFSPVHQSHQQLLGSAQFGWSPKVLYTFLDDCKHLIESFALDTGSPFEVTFFEMFDNFVVHVPIMDTYAKGLIRKKSKIQTSAFDRQGSRIIWVNIQRTQRPTSGFFFIWAGGTENGRLTGGKRNVKTFQG